MATKKTESVSNPVPEVRQCQDPENPSFGSVAVKSAVPFGNWLVANPGAVSINSAGGHWETGDEAVASWTPLGPENPTVTG